MTTPEGPNLARTLDLSRTPYHWERTGEGLIHGGTVCPPGLWGGRRPSAAALR